MKTLSTKFLLLKTDFFAVFAERKREILLYSILLLLGVALGIYVGVELGGAEEPFGLFARLFRLDYAPFGYILPELLRFSIFSVIASLSYYLPLYPIYPALALLFFGKHFGELSCLVFLSDSLPAAFSTTLFAAIPFLVLGGILLIRIALYATDFRVCDGGFFTPNNLKRTGYILFCSIVIYLLFLLLVYLIFCGLLYLLICVL